ncbi:Di-copper centre-containing protein [Ascobolus immersus RN42]|uniref:Di-copper centre-containing protein n=1 Tax=Ascobolus immersus RN42 TaxID=1160509 RepID=A0A3N4ID66_ASCIM|nr:Di-copper centre-containing protein [Ascobolus immersus RN42]
MKTTAFLSALVALAAVGSAAPAPVHNVFPVGATCSNPLQRKEWRQLTSSEKTSFYNAVKCLHNPITKPAQLGHIAPGVRTRFEDFIAEHQRQTATVHYVAHFFAWHRLFLSRFEQELRQCGYNAALPYWDYTIDTANLLGSPVLADFGGDGAFDPNADRAFGAMGGGCITSGPFSQAGGFRNISLGENTNTGYAPHCLTRNVKNLVGQVWLNPGREAEAVAKPTWEEFAVTLEGGMIWDTLGMHSGGHFGVSGTVGDMYTSPADPLFYLHHANLDRIWAKWQKQSPANLFAVGGSIKPRIQDLNPPNVPDIQMTSWFPINLGVLAGIEGYTTVGRLLDTKGTVPAGHLVTGSLCYEYV